VVQCIQKDAGRDGERFFWCLGCCSTPRHHHRPSQTQNNPRYALPYVALVPSVQCFNVITDFFVYCFAAAQKESGTETKAPVAAARAGGPPKRPATGAGDEHMKSCHLICHILNVRMLSFDDVLMRVWCGMYRVICSPCQEEGCRALLFICRFCSLCCCCGR
jgi:hypothetical protein